MNSKTKLGIGAALAGAFALGVTVVAFSVAQPTAGGASQSIADEKDQTRRMPAPVTILDRAPVETSFSDLQEDEIRALVHEYLMTNPEIIIEAVNEYSRRQYEIAQQRAVVGARKHLAALLEPEHGFVAGRNPDKAKVAVIEVFDYHCSYCKRAAPLVKALMEKEQDIKVVFREYPILRAESDYAAEIALAAREQGKFLDMHFAMMEATGTLTKDRIAKIAKKEGVNLAKLEKARQDPSVPLAINETLDIVREMGVDGTPAFIVASLDGDYVNVVQGFDPETLMESIDAARAAN